MSNKEQQLVQIEGQLLYSVIELASNVIKQETKEFMVLDNFKVKTGPNIVDGKLVPAESSVIVTTSPLGHVAETLASKLIEIYKAGVEAGIIIPEDAETKQGLDLK